MILHEKLDRHTFKNAKHANVMCVDGNVLFVASMLYVHERSHSDIDAGSSSTRGHAAGNNKKQLFNTMTAIVNEMIEL